MAFAFTTSTHHFTGGLSQCNKIRKKIKVIYIGKEKVKLPLIPNDKIISVENPREMTKNPPKFHKMKYYAFIKKHMLGYLNNVRRCLYFI